MYSWIFKDSPVSAKNARLETSLKGKRVHFNEDPVSHIVEIPRAPDGKHTRRKLQLSGYDQKTLVGSKSKQEMEQKLHPSQAPHNEPTPINIGMNAIYPDLANSKEPIAVIVPHLTTGNWTKILITDLKNNGIAQVGQLAAMDHRRIRTLRGLRPRWRKNKAESVKKILKTFHQKSLEAKKEVDGQNYRATKT